MVYRGTTILNFMVRARALALAMVLALPLACASAPAETAGFSEPAAVTSTRGPVKVSSIDVRDTGNGSELRLTADGPLVWTQYRDDAGNLVVELPNSVAADGVTSQQPGGLIAAIDVLSQANGERPLTRLVISTSQQAEHTLLVDDRVLSLEFVPTAPRATRVTESVPSSGTTASPSPAVLEPAPVAPARIAESVPGAMIAEGTPDAPFVSPPPTGVVATRLEGIEPTLIEGVPGVYVRGDGEFSFSSFQLEEPARFVVDLDGVVNTSAEPTVILNDGVVRQVRTAQFRPYPEPVSRVVFDLADLGTPRVVRTQEGLLITFSDDAPPSMQATPVAVVAEVEPEPEPAMEQPEPTPVPAAQETLVAEATPAPAVLESEPEALAPVQVAEEELATPEVASQPVEVDTPQIADASVTTESPMPTPAEPALEEESVTAAPATTVVELQEEPLQIAEVAPEPALRPESPRPLEIEDGSRTESPVWEPETSDVSLFEAQEVRLNETPRPAREEGGATFNVQALGNEKQYYGEPVTMSLKDADITEVLRSIARIADLNIVIQPGVNGPVTVELYSVPWDQALEQILKVNNLGQQLEGNILRIAPVSQLQAEAQAEQALKQARRLSVPLTTVMKRISYARASEIARILTQGVQNQIGNFGGQGAFGDQGILSQRGTVNVDDRTNTLIIQELPDYLDTVLQVIENLDIPEKQVMIEARIIETTRNFSRSLGVDWSFSGVADNIRGNTTGLEFPNNIDANGGVQLLTGGQNGFLNLGLGNVLNTFELDMTINAAENDGLVNIISAPKVATLNNVQATIQTGLQIPIQTVANNTVTVQFVNATLRLEVTPQVTAEGTIMMEINIQKREPLLAFAVVGATNAPIATREASTRVIVRDGGTAVIGGIYEVSTNEGEDRVPGLANIPIIGHLFKNKSRSNQNEELLIFITPRVIQL